MRKAAVSFTGGKDCVLSLHLVHAGNHAAARNSAADLQSDAVDVTLLLTFAPKGNVKFKAHPLSMIEAQASALGLKHVLVEVGDPYLESYRSGITQLRSQHGIDVLVTGDILDVCNGFMRRATEGTGVELLCPLWQLPRQQILQQMWDLGISPIISCINITKFGQQAADDDTQQAASCKAATSSASPPKQPQQQEHQAQAQGEAPATEQDESTTSSATPEQQQQQKASKGGNHKPHDAPSSPSSPSSLGSYQDPIAALLGQELSISLLQGPLHHYGQQYGVDAAGEGGEYHTMVLDAPLFRHRLQLQWQPQVEGAYAFLDVSSIQLVSKEGSGTC